jgi:hypothetical protein
MFSAGKSLFLTSAKATIPSHNFSNKCTVLQALCLAAELMSVCVSHDLLYDLVVRVPDYRSRGPGSIPGATRFCDK